MKSSIIQKSFCLLLTILLTPLYGLAFSLDLSVDEEIRKNYNSSKLEQQELPPLPKTATPLSKTVTSQPKTNNVKTQSAPPKFVPIANEPKYKKVNKNLPNSTLTKDDFTAIKIKKGTRIKLKSNSVVSDYLPVGAKVSFVTLEPVYQKYVTLPVGTTFKATVVDSHQPQLTGNGGLVELVIDSVVFRGRTYRANGKITKANHKKIFLNSIKGKRQYMNNWGNQISKGENFYKKTRKASNKLADNPVGILISPVPVLVGMGGYAVNFVLSPVISGAGKGKRISIPAGSEFEIKLRENIYLSL